MSLKQKRIHYTGISNLDFRTKNDIKRIKLYQPYHESKPFGMQGLSNYKIPSNIHKAMFAPTKGNNEGKYLKSNAPNPRNYESALFYKENSMTIKPKAIGGVERSQQLDTSEYWGGHEFNGDSMMISEIMKKRKEIKLKEKLMHNNNIKHRLNINEDNKNREMNKYIPNIKKMLKSKSEVFLNEKISKERLKQIQYKIFNRLKTHDDIKGIFIKWQNDYCNNGELSIYDLHKIINDLGIKINYNETSALISCANKRNTDRLNFDEFKNLVTNDDFNIDIDLSKIPYQKESLFPEKHIIEEENMNQQYKYKTIENKDNYIKLQKIVRNRYPIFIKKLSQNKNNNLTGSCEKNTFTNIINSMKIPEKYKNKEIINTVFDKYKNINNHNLIDYEKYIEDSKNLDEKNDFFRFQNGYLGLIENKLEKNEAERIRYNEILLENARRKNNYLQSQLASMRRNISKNKSDSDLLTKSVNLEINKEKKYYLENQNRTDINNLESKQFNSIEKEKNISTDLNNNINNNQNIFYNHYQPSLNFIYYLFKDNKIYHDRYYQSIDEISPLIQSKIDGKNNSLNKNFNELEKIKREKVANSHKFDKHFLSADTEQDKNRFKRYDISKEERENKIKYLENSLKRKYETNQKWNDKINFQQQIFDINNSLGQIKRTESMYRYEKKIKEMNNIL